MTFDYNLVKKQKKNFDQINLILSKAHQTLKASSAILNISHESAFTNAYESMLKATLALMLADGIRPKIQLGHHKILTNYAESFLRPLVLRRERTFLPELEELRFIKPCFLARFLLFG